MSRCKSCQAEIIWAVSEGDRPVPLDAKPIRVFTTTDTGAELVIVQSVVGHVSHFATCPNAAKHRKPREPRG